MTVDACAIADAATLWVIRRYIRKPAAGKIAVRFASAHGVLLSSGWIVTTAHNLAADAAYQPEFQDYSVPVGRRESDGEMIIRVWKRPLDLGADPQVTVALAEPPESPVRKPTGAQLLAHGPRLLADPSEIGVHPVFVEPHTDLALLGECERGELDPIRSALRPMSVRRRPLTRGERVYMRSRSGWRAAIVEAASLTPNALLRVEGVDLILKGDCGGPVADSHGELVGVVSKTCKPALPPANGYDGTAIVAQLSQVLPAWVLAA